MTFWLVKYLFCISLLKTKLNKFNKIPSKYCQLYQIDRRLYSPFRIFSLQTAMFSEKPFSACFFPGKHRQVSTATFKAVFVLQNYKSFPNNSPSGISQHLAFTKPNHSIEMRTEPTINKSPDFGRWFCLLSALSRFVKEQKRCESGSISFYVFIFFDLNKHSLDNKHQ